MANANGYVLILSADREALFHERIDEDGFFAEPVAEFAHSRTAPLVCFLVDQRARISHIAFGSRGVRAGTDFRRLNVRDAFPLKHPVKIGRITSAVPPRVRAKVVDRFAHGGLFSPKAFEATIEALVDAAPETREVMSQFLRTRRQRIAAISHAARKALAYQQQALLTALKIGGFDGSEIQDWVPPTEGSPDSFLDGLQNVRLREDPMIVNDLLNVPGFSFLKAMAFGAAVFQSDDVRLTVVLANRLPLEEQTGTDLIYYNETYHSFVMVQYKSMEVENGEAGFRVPNAQLDEEIERMDALLATIRACSQNTECDGFRFNENPFFLKLCSRVVFAPDDVKIVPGMYLHLDHWKLLHTDERLKGPRGGRRVTYKNVGRYIDNTDFIRMVKSAWVGTTISQSTVLAALIRDVVENGRAVMLAIRDANVDREGASNVTDYLDDES